MLYPAELLPRVIPRIGDLEKDGCYESGFPFVKAESFIAANVGSASLFIGEWVLEMEEFVS